jgi:hypothetical protein
MRFAIATHAPPIDSLVRKSPARSERQLLESGNLIDDQVFRALPAEDFAIAAITSPWLGAT